MKFLIFDKDQVDQVHILTKIYEKKSSDSCDHVTIPHAFRQFWKKAFFSGVIVSVNRRRKDIKVTFVSFNFHSGKFTVEYKEYRNKLFSYFDIFIYVSSNFT